MGPITIFGQRAITGAYAATVSGDIREHWPAVSGLVATSQQSPTTPTSEMSTQSTQSHISQRYACGANALHPWCKRNALSLVTLRYARAWSCSGCLAFYLGRSPKAIEIASFDDQGG